MPHWTYGRATHRGRATRLTAQVDAAVHATLYLSSTSCYLSIIMATLSALKRLARLGGWIGLSTGAMVVAACSSLLGACKSTALHTTDASRDTGGGNQPDAAVADANPAKPDAANVIVMPDAGGLPEAGGEAHAPVDADKADLWTVICE
jgi:hypothetical protein